MNLDTARTTVIAALARMDSLYNKAVFDEWVLFKLASEKGVILAYSGPRADSYQKKFKEDIVPLRTELEQRKLAVGDFAFVDDAASTQFDACIRLGPAAYLFCNHTEKTMEQIRANPLWREAQTPFAKLSQMFGADPLE